MLKGEGREPGREGQKEEKVKKGEKEMLHLGSGTYTR